MQKSLDHLLMFIEDVPQGDKVDWRRGTSSMVINQELG